MANTSHLAYIYEGMEAWNAWRATSKIRPDLRHAPLSRISLAGYNFSGADCREASLSQSDLSGCQFGGADLGLADLRATQLTGAALSHTSFYRSKLAGVDLSGARPDTINFSQAQIENGLFSNARMRFCEFQKATLCGSDLSNSTLYSTNLEGADLRYANFHKARLSNVSLTDAWLWDTRTTDWKLDGITCSRLRIGREGKVNAFEIGQFAEIFATKIIKIQLADGQDAFEIASLQNFIHLLGPARGSFFVTVHSDDLSGSEASSEVVIKIEPRSAIDFAEVERLNTVIKGLEIIQIDKEKALETEQKRVAALTERLVTELMLSKPSPVHADFQEQEMLTVAVFDLTGSSDYGEEENLIRTAKFWSSGLALVTQMGAKYINTWGDSLIACFKDDHLALNSAWELIAALKAIGIQCRAGLHHGTVWIRFNPVISKLDIAGPTVHLAARLEPQADPGTVLVSTEVKAMTVARNRGDFEFQDKEVIFQKGAGKFAKGDTYLASIAIRRNKL